MTRGKEGRMRKKMGTRWRILARRWSIVSPSVSTLVWMRVNYGDVTTMADTNLHVKSRGAPVFAPPTTNPFSYAAIVPDLSVFRTKYVKRSSPATPAPVSGVVSSASAVARVENSARLLAVGMIKKKKRRRTKERKREGRDRCIEFSIFIVTFFVNYSTEFPDFPLVFPKFLEFLPTVRARFGERFDSLFAAILYENSRINVVELFWKKDE